MPVEGVQSVERALTILETLSEAGGALTLTELASRVNQRLNVSLSTVYRLLAALVRWGYVVQNGPRGRYTIGQQALKLAASAGVGRQSDLRREARPILQDLTQRAKETTNLVELQGGAAIYADQVTARRSVVLFAQIGKRAPFYCTGAGKTLLAFQPKKAIETYLANTPLRPRNGNTITDPNTLRDKLAAIRAQGYAFDDGEFEEDVHCVAAPVFDQAGRAIAAVSISAPAMRFPRERMEELAPLLVEAAQQLSHRLGYRA